jgi:hypothetical protein
MDRAHSGLMLSSATAQTNDSDLGCTGEFSHHDTLQLLLKVYLENEVKQLSALAKQVFLTRGELKWGVS